MRRRTAASARAHALCQVIEDLDHGVGHPIDGRLAEQDRNGVFELRPLYTQVASLARAVSSCVRACKTSMVGQAR